ncbi:MAG: 1-deoxy-D-xylulose-5-phosphate synthase N-terminal domain-containing protein [Acidimicrobiia bacterium]|nr:MAG: 1-deoxy-D-xylulose-5-phosphate synthase N-terminal domain-containing protein [Acidimicrobiia bacterium]
MTIPIERDGTIDFEALGAIEQRLLWLSARMIDHANKREITEIKVGGHQASCASMATIMTALWFAHIGGEDKVAVKPHAAPLYHGIKYLTGELDRSYLKMLRQRGGLQAYPSRTKDPDVADFSTGSVGLGAVAPLFSAATRRYVEDHFETPPPARFIAIAGDAELDEGNIWEAISDPSLQGLGNVMLIIDLNRQSLDRVIPGIQAKRLMRFFRDAGWHVVEAKYGMKLLEAFARPGGKQIRDHIDAMSNEEYQSLFAFDGAELRSRFLANADPGVDQAISAIPDSDIASVIQNLGGHDLEVLINAYRECDTVTDRPSVVFAYTIKGWGLPIVGDPMNHSALMSSIQIDDLRSESGLIEETEWDRFDETTPAGVICARVGNAVNNEPPPPRPHIVLPPETDARHKPIVSTQEAFGRILVALGKDEAVAGRIVTVSPDVSVSTNLGGWINAHGVYAATERHDYFEQDRMLRWKPSPVGRHIELGISEMNLFLLLGQLGLAHEHHGEMLIPIGTVYDPFVLRGLDALIYSLYNGSKFILAGTPAGITLSPEGGAHQSTITPSVGLELPGITQTEPTYALAVDWLLSDAIGRLSEPDAPCLYLRMSTRPIDQAPFTDASQRIGTGRLRHNVLAGGYRLREGGSGEPLILAASGPVMPEVLAAADILAEEGVAATVLDITSLDRLYRGWHDELTEAARTSTVITGSGHIESLIPISERGAPIVTIHDAASHAMAWLGSVFGQRVVPIGVDRFGESGTIGELYEAFGLLPHQIATAGLVAIDNS